MKHKRIALMALVMSIVSSLSACGSVAENTSVAISVETESVEESTEESEAFVSEEEFDTDATESTEPEAMESVEPETTETEETVTETPESVAESAEIEVKTVADYTYTDLNNTMYATSTVNVRSLPSTNGDKLGCLSKNQEVIVIGQCNETGWYRISFNGSESYVSNKYLSDEPVAAAAGTTQAQGDKATGTASANSNSTVSDMSGNGMITDADSSNIPNGFNRSVAEQVWSLMNAERTAAGLNALTWDENIYNYACARAQEIVTDFSHNGCFSGYGENCLFNSVGTAESIHNQWKNSPGHHANYMNTIYGSGACAVYTVNGTTYAVEIFMMLSGSQTDSTLTQELL